jgi:hypothetical protein
VEFSLAVPGILFGRTTGDLTDLAVQFDGVFEFEMRLGLLVGLQVLLALALVFAQRTKKGLARPTIHEAVANLPLMLHRQLGCIALLLAVAHTLPLDDAEPHRARRVLDMVEA